jgi:hypothetical protein
MSSDYTVAHGTSGICGSQYLMTSQDTKEFSWVWWCIPVTPTLGRLRQKNGECEASSGLQSEMLSQKEKRERFPNRANPRRQKIKKLTQ